jgi:hypothetical protein
MSETDIRRLLTDAADEAGPLEASPDTVLRRVRRRRRLRASASTLTVAGILLCAAALTAHPAPDPAARPAGRTPAGPAAETPRCEHGPDPTAARPTTGPQLGDRTSCQYIGLTLQAARKQAATERRYLTIKSQDGTHHAITYQLDPHRVVVDLEHGHVVAASVG